MQDQEKGRMLTPAEVADIWNERAREMGYPDTNYTRFSVRQRHRKGKAGEELKPALETPMGYLYWEKDVREITLYPKKSRRQVTKKIPAVKKPEPEAA